MSLITDPLYLIHISRVKFLRMDERGERIITFPPTVMSDDYVRLAAPVYPEMQYCYSPVYDNYMNDSGGFNNGLTSSPRTTKRNYRHRKQLPSNANTRYNQQYVAPNANAGASTVITHQKQQQRQQRLSSSRLQEATTDSEEEDVEVEDNLSKPLETEDLSVTETSLTNEAATRSTATAVATSNTTLTKTAAAIVTSSMRSYPSASLHPSVDSAIDPSPRSSIDEQGNINFTSGAFDSSLKRINAINTADKEDHMRMLTEGTPPSPLEYTKKQLPILSRQPSARPQYASALSALIAEKATAAENPFAEYSFVSGKGESKSITLCVYLPTSNKPYTPVSLVVRPDAITDDVIGYILYDYVEQKREPELEEAAYDLAEWVLLIAEDDGEIEDDLPAVDRTRNIGRVQFDQFALCRATPSQAKQNDLDRAKMGRSKPDLETLRKKKQAATMTSALNLSAQQPSSSQQSLGLQDVVEDASDMEVDIPLQQQLDATTSPSATSDPHMNETIMSHSHLMTQQTTSELDASTVAVPVPSSKATLTKATMPMTPLKFFRIKLMTNEEVSATTTIPAYAEMFIGDVLELLSRKRKLNPNEYMLTIADSNVIVPIDTTVESMKGITDLTLTKKGAALTIPSSTHLWRSPIKRKKDEVSHPMYFSTTESPTAGPSAANANDALLSQYKKYTVSRKMPMFVSKRLYILAIDGDYIHLMPPEHKGMFDSVKTTSFHASAVRSCKQSKKVPTNFKIIILKERVFKTYDLEAESAKEASEICNRIHFLVQVTK